MLKKINWFLFVPTVLIAVLGIVTLLSTAIGEDGSIVFAPIVRKQILFVLIGAVAYLISSKLDLSYTKYIQIIGLIYIATLILLILTLFFGNTVKGARRWIEVFGIQLQPSEIAKLTIIFSTAYIFTLRERYSEWVLLLFSFLAIIPILVLVYLQPHGSMTLILVLIWAVCAFVLLGRPLRSLLILGLMALNIAGIWGTLFGTTWLIALSVIAFVVAIFALNSSITGKPFIILGLIFSLIVGLSGNFIWSNVLSDYQRDRIVGEEAFQVEQAKIAIGSGKIWGKGFGNGTQSRLHFLPEQQNDFIFATYAEQFGLIGSIFLVSLYIFILLQIASFARQTAHDTFISAILIGLLVKVLLEVFINLGTNTGLVPPTGIPLPLMSAGGTITITTFFSLGIIQSIMSGLSGDIDTPRFVDNV